MWCFRRSRSDEPDTRRWALCAVSVVGLFLAGADRTHAQESPGTPIEVVATFYDAIGAHRWDAAASALHPEALDLFRLRLDSMLDADTTGRLATLVFGQEDGPALRSRSNRRFFATLLEAIESDTPGLIAVIATNQYDPIGHVDEGPDLAHVVLRVTPFTNGSAPTRTTLVTLKGSPAGWGIIESGALESLATAMTGLSLTAKGSR